MPPTGDTLTPTYGSPEQKGVFAVPAEYANPRPELTAEITPADTTTHQVEADPKKLADLARSQALAASTVMPPAAPTQETVAAKPKREGIDTSEAMAYQEVAVDGPAVVQIRLAALSDASRQHNAELN